MKHQYIIIGIFILSFFLFGCKKEKLETPSGSLRAYVLGNDANEYPADTIHILETVTFVVEGDADYYAVWSGDPGYNYSNRLPANKDTAVYVKRDKGIAMDSEDIYGRKVKDHKYKATGVFTVVLVASNIDRWGENRVETVTELNHKIVVIP